MRTRSDHGQATVLTVVFLVVLLGMAALVLDIGSWYRADRATQSTADAAALAGAQALPGDSATANSLAQQYATKNGGLGGGGVTFSSKIVSNDTITVTVKRAAPTFFAKIFGKNSVTVGSTATARSEGLSAARYVAPIVVHYKHPLLNCKGPASKPTCAPDFGPSHTTTLDLEDLHQSGGGSGSGAFGLLNLNYGDSTGNIGAGTLADWLLHGYDADLPLGTYYSAPSANFNNSQFLSSLDAVLGKEVLFPVYRLLTGPGSNAKYDIIGWVGFVITSYNTGGSSGTLTGYFTSYT
ncbi:MAG TPA: pilus assembly protein TadG-related protein, partial [Gaiellaceae bacterium]